MSNEMAIKELETLEDEMENAKNHFGATLKTIRDKKLWAAQYESFEAYCQARWKFTRQRAHQIIQAAEIVAALPMDCQEFLTNDGQKSALAPIPQKQRPAVIREAAKQGPLTARSIGVAARQIAAPTPEPEAPDVAPEADDLIRDAIAAHKMVRAEENVLRGVLDRLRAIPERSRVYLCMESIEARLRGAAWEIKHSAPAQYCPFCGGDATCDVCHSTGYVTQAIYDMAPAELKLGKGA